MAEVPTSEFQTMFMFGAPQAAPNSWNLSLDAFATALPSRDPDAFLRLDADPVKSTHATARSTRYATAEAVSGGGIQAPWPHRPRPLAPAPSTRSSALLDGPVDHFVVLLPEAGERQLSGASTAVAS